MLLRRQNCIIWNYYFKDVQSKIFNYKLYEEQLKEQGLSQNAAYGLRMSARNSSVEHKQNLISDSLHVVLDAMLIHTGKTSSQKEW